MTAGGGGGGADANANAHQFPYPVSTKEKGQNGSSKDTNATTNATTSSTTPAQVNIVSAGGNLPTVTLQSNPLPSSSSASSSAADQISHMAKMAVREGIATTNPAHANTSSSSSSFGNSNNHTTDTTLPIKNPLVGDGSSPAKAATTTATNTTAAKTATATTFSTEQSSLPIHPNPNFANSKDVPVPNPLFDNTKPSSTSMGDEPAAMEVDDYVVDDDDDYVAVDSPIKEGGATNANTNVENNSHGGKGIPIPSFSHALLVPNNLKKPPPPPPPSTTTTTTVATVATNTQPSDELSSEAITFTHALFGAGLNNNNNNKNNNNNMETRPGVQTATLSTTTPTTAVRTATDAAASASAVMPMDVDKEKNDNDNGKTIEKDTNTDNTEMDVEILTKRQAEKEWRRKRKKLLKKQLEDAAPSFVAILEGPIQIAEEDPEEEEEKKKKAQEKDVAITKIVVNVDEYFKMGALNNVMLPNAVQSSSNRFAVPASRSPQSRRTMSMPGGTPAPVPSSAYIASPVTSMPTPTATAAAAAAAAAIDADPKEEGYYEGVKLMSMAEDEVYLSKMQQWIRRNLEFFSATKLDAQMSQSGRRQRAVRGKVGIRCVHCARALLPKFESKLNTNAIKYEQWPPGSVSYPATMDGMYSSCSQRPQLHFKTCPHMSSAMLIQGSEWISGEGEGGTQAPKKRKRCREGVSALMYYHIACERIGLVETAGGLRFTRDLQLEPLPLEQARHKIEETKPELTVKPRQRQVSHFPMAISSSSSLNAYMPQSQQKQQQVKAEKTPCTNEECQQLLQEALQEEDDLSVRLACKGDNEMVSDYTFLAIKQMSLCHASPLDFVSRGKKTKLMRLGFAGFCCRHCHGKNIATHACRSYSSAPDNLASAISNSFVLHLAKCPHTPTKVKQALVALKKIHSKQMQQLPYGSQRKCFLELWKRMRASDKVVEGQENPTAEQMAAASAEAGLTVSASNPDSVRSTSVATAIDTNRKNSRSDGFPVSSNEMTLRVLKNVEQEWDPTKDNDCLMDKDDRFLISDYVFLTMRQLDTALPTASDFRGNRRQNTLQRMADCGFVSSGRSFPSAPDNMASAFNTSLYNHMQACPGVPVELKSALYDLRKIHSMQCQNLVFGSQRKFFNKVFGKLKKVPIPESVLQALPSVSSPSKKPPYRTSYGTVSVASDEVLTKNSFVTGPTLGGFPAFYQCLRCRAVPFAFRAPGCVLNSRPSADVVVNHAMACQGDGVFMGFVKTEFDGLTEDYEFLSQLKPFQDLVRHVVGSDEELTTLFSDPEEAKAKDTNGWWRRLPATVDFDEAQKLFDKVASDLSISSHRLQDQPKLIRYLQTISPNFQLPLPSAPKEANRGDSKNDRSTVVEQQGLANFERGAATNEATAGMSAIDAGSSSVTEASNAIQTVAAASIEASSPPEAASTLASSAQSTATSVAEVKPDDITSTSQFKDGIAAATASDGQKEILIENDEGVFV
ncbi:MAG: hypothetical protein SGBAC_006046 [Bacillariaceae sp.]